MSVIKRISVVDILDASHVVLNIGALQGIKMDDRFVVFGNDREIKDTDGKSLGYLELVKGYGDVTHVQDTLCVLTSNTYTGFKADTDSTPHYIRLSSGNQNFLLVLKGDFARKV